MFLVSFMATLVALTVMSMTRLVYLTAPYRMKLPLLRSDVKDRVREPATPSTGEDEATREEYVAANRRFLRRMCPWAVEGRAVVFGLLAIPLIFAIWRISPKQSVLWLVGGWLLAVALAVFMQYQGESLVEKLGRALHRGSGASRWRPMLERGPVLPRLFEGFAGKGHAPIAMMALVAMGVYLGLSPIFMDAGASRALANQISPIAYVFLVAGVLVWLSTVTSLVFDRSRVPVGLAVALWLVVGYGVSKSDHFYRIVPDSGRMSELPTPAEVVQARHEGLTGDYITVVAASGGGIKASLWTARVLQGLDQDVGPSLTRSIVLLSTNSGGSVGGMYYTDAFDSSGLSAERLDSVVSAAGQSSLSAVVWGMAYPDLLRVVTGGIWICDVWERMTPWPAPCDRWRSVDRGWAMDRRWEETRRAALGWDEGSGKDGASESAASPRRLGDWVAGVRQGWRPAHIFNATAVETGAAVRIATVRLSDPEGGTGTEPRFAPGSEPREFADLYPKADVDVVTAARLSASFPWVSPLARAWMAPVDIRAVAGPSASDRHKYAAGIDSTAFHLGDGGYFDNFGVYSALDFLHRLDSSVLPGQGAHPIRRVIFIEIRATPEGLGRPTEGGFAYSAIGPLLTMDHVRNSSQIGRNNREIELMREAWAEKGITLCPAVFELTVQGPLSWLLTRDERDSLENAWKGDTLQAHTRMLKQYLEEPDPGPKGCPAALSDGDPPGATAAAVAGGTGR